MVDNIFKVVSVVALVVGVYAVNAAPSGNTNVASHSLNDVHKVEINKLKDQLNKVNDELTALKNKQNTVMSRTVVTPADTSDIVNNPISKDDLEKIVESKVEEKMAAVQSEDVKNNGYYQYTIQKPKTMEEVAKELDLDDFTVSTLKQYEKESQDAIAKIFKNEDETVEDFKLRMEEMSKSENAEDYAMEFASKLFENGNMVKLTKIQREQKKKEKELLGDKYGQYAKIPKENGSGLPGFGGAYTKIEVQTTDEDKK